ncbi:MAG: hypothetical protein R6X14_05300 [bacterium]
MYLLIATAAMLGGLTAPGRTATLTEVQNGRIRTAVVSHLQALGDTTINLEGSWGMAVNAGNFDNDPELEYAVRLSAPGQSNTYISRLVVLDHDLRVMWAQEWGYMGNPEQNSVTVADLDRDGRDDIILAMAETFFPDPPTYKGRVYAVDGGSGQVKPGWPYILPGWPDDPYNEVYGEVVAADLDGDDTLEVVFITTDFNSARKGGGHCYALSHRGDSLWRYTFYPGDTINQHGCWTGPAVTDLDGDGRKEIVCHFNLHSNTNPWPLLERRLFILNHDGSLRRSWQTQGAMGSQNTDYASPVVADVSGDGAPEIVVLRRSGWLDLFDTLGTRLPGFPVDLTADAGYTNPVFTKAFSCPAVADLDGNGRLEIIVGSFGLVGSPADWGGHVHVFRADGSVPDGFPYPTRNAVWHSPGVGDADSVPGPEILTAGCDSSFYVISAKGESLPGWPKRDFPTYFLPDEGNHGFYEGKIPLCRTPFLTDATGDGLTDILMSGTDGLFYLWGTPAAYDPVSLPWPTHRLDRARTGSAWLPGVAVRERPGLPRPVAIAGPTILRGVLRLPASLITHHSSLITSDGRKVMDLQPGDNDVRHLSPGVYFVRPATGSDASDSRRVVITR